jgi:hypothetical protein
MLIAPYSQLEGRTHDDVLADVPQRPAHVGELGAHPA